MGYKSNKGVSVNNFLIISLYNTSQIKLNKKSLKTALVLTLSTLKKNCLQEIVSV
mgnify:FL=1